MIAIDGSPLAFGPFSVARMLRGWLQGWPGVEAPDGPRLLLPAGEAPAGFPPAHVRHDGHPCPSPRAFRRRLPQHVMDAHAQGLLCPWMATPDLRSVGLPVVATVHELPWVRHGPIEGHRRAWSQRVWLRRLVGRSAAVLVPSIATRDDLARARPELAARTHVVPHGFDPTPWEAARRIPDDPPYALMLGCGDGRAHAHKKGLDVLLAAFERARPPGWRLVLVGKPACRMPEGVTARTPVEGEDLHALVAGASLLVYPSRMEGFGFPPLEAMAADVPVLATDAGSIPEVVGDAAVIVPAGDVDALARALTAIAGDPDRREALRARGRARARAFPVVAAGRAIVDVFASLGVRA